MRIIAGRLGGRQFSSPHGQRTHPMSDKIRGALFNALGDIEGLTVLDAFAGSGALAFEALSRGAGRATLIEVDRAAQRTIAANIAALGLTDSAQLIRASAGAWLSTSDERFDIILADPPYDYLQFNLLGRLAGRLIPGGLLVLSGPGSEPLPPFEGLEQVMQKPYGDAQLGFYRAS